VIRRIAAPAAARLGLKPGERLQDAVAKLLT